MGKRRVAIVRGTSAKDASFAELNRIEAEQVKASTLFRRKGVNTKYLKPVAPRILPNQGKRQGRYVTRKNGPCGENGKPDCIDLTIDNTRRDKKRLRTQQKPNSGSTASASRVDRKVRIIKKMKPMDDRYEIFGHKGPRKGKGNQSKGGKDGKIPNHVVKKIRKGKDNKKVVLTSEKRSDGIRRGGNPLYHHNPSNPRKLSRSALDMTSIAPTRFRNAGSCDHSQHVVLTPIRNSSDALEPFLKERNYGTIMSMMRRSQYKGGIKRVFEKKSRAETFLDNGLEEPHIQLARRQGTSWPDSEDLSHGSVTEKKIMDSLDPRMYEMCVDTLRKRKLSKNERKLLMAIEWVNMDQWKAGHGIRRSACKIFPLCYVCGYSSHKAADCEYHSLHSQNG